MCGGRGEAEPIPVTITCGTGEENLGNNRVPRRERSARDGWQVELVEHPDAHNWISWRDSLHPHLADLTPASGGVRREDRDGILVYGSYGKPLLVFPAERGNRYEWERTRDDRRRSPG